jgi:hypothetical protein
MAKKTKKASQPKKVIEAPKQFSKEEIEAALQISHSEYFMNVIALLSHDPDIQELTYTKVPITTPAGGNYLVSILHIGGPKLNLRDLAAAAEAQVELSKNKNG